MFKHVKGAIMNKGTKCRKCGKKEENLPTPLNSHGLCNDCYNSFLPYFREAMKKFIASKKRR